MSIHLIPQVLLLGKSVEPDQDDHACEIATLLVFVVVKPD